MWHSCPNRSDTRHEQRSNGNPAISHVSTTPGDDATNSGANYRTVCNTNASTASTHWVGYVSYGHSGI